MRLFKKIMKFNMNLKPKSKEYHQSIAQQLVKTSRQIKPRPNTNDLTLKPASNTKLT